jgi:hypothetical protein
MNSHNTKSNKALDALRSVNQKEMFNQQFNQQIHKVHEDQEQEDEGSDGTGGNRRMNN